MATVTPFDEKAFLLGRRYGRIHGPLLAARGFFRRLAGRYGVEDQLAIACMCEPPLTFLRHGVMISHAYGITLSADEIGADCSIGQNVTIGTDGRGMPLGASTDGHKPKIGNLVSVYAGAVVSGDIRIGDRVVIGANAFCSRDVPSDTAVYGINRQTPLRPHHAGYLADTLWHCINIYKLVPGLVYADHGMFLDEEYAAQRGALLERLKDAAQAPG